MARRRTGSLAQIDAPLGESLERYRVTISGSTASIEVQTDEPALTVAASELAQLGAAQASIEVRQIGDAAASRPAQISINI